MPKRKYRHQRVTQIVSPDVTIHQPTNIVTAKELWCQVAVAVASSDNAVNKDSMISWADLAVEQFNARFK